MQEASRFLRYVLPGLAPLLLLLVSVEVFTQASVLGTAREHDISALSIVVGSFVLSGGLGYLFSIGYWWLCWCSPRWLRNLSVKGRPLFIHLPVDHRQAVGEQEISFRFPDRGLSLSDPEAEEKRRAWVSLTVCWWAQGEDGMLKPALERSKRLADIAHGLGTAMVGTFLFSLVFLVVAVVSVLHGINSWWAAVGPLVGAVCWCLTLVVQYQNQRAAHSVAADFIDLSAINAGVTAGRWAEGE